MPRTGEDLELSDRERAIAEDIVNTENGACISIPESGRRLFISLNNGDATFQLANRDFDVLSFRSNLVLRWEWRPGSSLFVVWQQNRSESAADGRLVGGLYGVRIGAAFFGESMFNRKNNMGKVAFHALVEHLRRNGSTLFDTQYLNPFTEKLGAIEIPRSHYLELLEQAIEKPVEFRSGPKP